MILAARALSKEFPGDVGQQHSRVLKQVVRPGDFEDGGAFSVGDEELVDLVPIVSEQATGVVVEAAYTYLDACVASKGSQIGYQLSVLARVFVQAIQEETKPVAQRSQRCDRLECLRQLGLIPNICFHILGRCELVPPTRDHTGQQARAFAEDAV